MLSVNQFLSFLLGAVCLALPHSGQAQAYPNKPIRVIFPYPGGSVPDGIGRQVSQGVSDILGQPLVFENRAGANGVIGTEASAKAAPDGYTISWTTTSAFVFNSFLQKKLPYDPLKDLVAVTNAGDIPMAVMVHASMPANNVREYLEHAKKNRGKLSFGSFGTGSLPHLYGEMINRAAGADVLHVPFKGAAALVTDFVAGRVDVTYISIGSVLQHWKAGKVKVIAIASPKRHSALPDLPTLNEDLPNMELLANWMGYVAPAQVPRPIINQLHAAMMKVIHTPDFRKRLEGFYYTTVGNTPEEFGAALKKEFEVAGAAFKAAGIQPE
ncbi:MAG: ABC transporter substrate-binding protein [Betaproteobacteria bacterium]|nr:ABC transporter substrate-binding protein [Betaproteobacteria bacterium]